MPIDSEKLGGLLDRYWPVLVAWVGEARHEAEDVVQKAFIKLATQDPPPTNCVAWLFTVTKRLAINERLSRDRRRSRESKAACARTVADGAEDKTLAFEINDLLNRLEERQREVVIARIWGELSFEEIAAVYGQPKATIWRVYKAGIAELKDLYRRETGE